MMKIIKRAVANVVICKGAEGPIEMHLTAKAAAFQLEMVGEGKKML